MAAKRGAKVLTVDQMVRIAILWNGGWCGAEIARFLDHSPSTTTEALHRMADLSKDYMTAPWGGRNRATRAGRSNRLNRIYALSEALVEAGVEEVQWERRWTKDRLPHKEIERMVFMYQFLDLSVKEIAEQCHVCRTTVRWRLKKAGIQPGLRRGLEQAVRRDREQDPLFFQRRAIKAAQTRGHRTLTEAQVNEAKYLYEQEQLFLREIAERIGLDSKVSSMSLVRRALERNGVRMRTQAESHKLMRARKDNNGHRSDMAEEQAA